ncbi:MAG TPA: hypothetical protein PLU53_15485 [Bacteroidia bacterium]|nr:hypothetical protein [Bacteroidia bacterium]
MNKITIFVYQYYTFGPFHWDRKLLPDFRSCFTVKTRKPEGVMCIKPVDKTHYEIAQYAFIIHQNNRIVGQEHYFR